MKASLLYRIAAVLLVLFAVGHTVGFWQADPAWNVSALLDQMRSNHFDVQGFNRSYWDFFLGSGFTVGVFYLFAAILAWHWLEFRKLYRACGSQPGLSHCASL